jgi:hypothetical protein
VGKSSWARHKIGGREGFIPAPKEHELQRLLNIPEYPYLRKYLGQMANFEAPMVESPAIMQIIN